MNSSEKTPAGFSLNYLSDLSRFRSAPRPPRHPAELSIADSPPYFSFYYRTLASIAKLNAMLSTARQLDRRIIAPSFDSSDKSASKAEKLFRDANKLLKETQTELREVASGPRPHGPEAMGGSLCHAAQSHCFSLLARFANELRKAEIAHKMNLENGRESYSPFDVLRESNDDSSMRLYEADGTEVLVTELQPSKMKRPEHNLLSGASKLSRVIEEINSMCVAQGSVIDRIDFALDQAKKSAISGEQQLRIVKESLENSLTGKCLKLLVLLNLVVFLLLVLKLRARF